MDRRTFLHKLMLTAGVGLMPSLAFSDDDEDDDKSTNNNIRFSLANTGISNKQVIVVGGGMAGVTAAKYLRLWGGSGISVTLVEPNPVYVSNIMSNLVLSAGRTMTSLNFTYANLINNYGVTLKQASLVNFDNATKRATFSDGSSLPYDKLIMAPGIQMDDAYGLTVADYAGNYPHAWQAGPQTAKLASLVANMGNNDTLVMSIPAKPYRCPPGPYERACLIADYLKTHGKTGAKVVILDENPAIQAEAHSFTTAFNSIHAGYIQYVPNVTGMSVTKSSTNDGSGTVTYNGGTINAKVISLIPPHRAPGSDANNQGIMYPLCVNSDNTRLKWAPVNVLNYESTVANMTGVHIIGDASSTTQPKAGHIANQEAKVCADAIVRAFQNQAPDAAPVTNSACYSPITNSTASWLTGVYQYDSASKTMRLWANGNFTDTAVEADSITTKNFSRMNTWFTTLMNDSFG